MLSSNIPAKNRLSVLNYLMKLKYECGIHFQHQHGWPFQREFTSLSVFHNAYADSMYIAKDSEFITDLSSKSRIFQNGASDAKIKT
jgi:hypothetical protein